MIKNYKDYIIIHFINQEPIHGYDLLKKVNMINEIKKITLYKTLERLESSNIITVKEVSKRRKMYTLTDTGIVEFKDKSKIYPKVLIKNYTKIGNTSEHFESIDSTNLYLKNIGDNFEDGHVVYADYQTKGRGRLSRVWESESSRNIALSILVKPDVQIHQIPKLTQVAAATIFTVLKELGIDAKIKWPNDILVDGKKICGILVESKLAGDKPKLLVIGIGLNVNISNFSDEIKDKATSMKLITNLEYDCLKIRELILTKFETFYNQFINDNHSYLEICRKESFLIGKKVLVDFNGREQSVEVKEISDNGQLIVELDNEMISLSISEVTLEKNY